MLRVVLPLDGIQYVTFISRHVPRIGTLRSNDEDGNKNVQKKKTNRFNKQNNNFASASRFIVHFIFARLRRENA